MERSSPVRLVKTDKEELYRLGLLNEGVVELSTTTTTGSTSWLGLMYHELYILPFLKPFLRILIHATLFDNSEISYSI